MDTKIIASQNEINNELINFNLNFTINVTQSWKDWQDKQLRRKNNIHG